MRFIASSALIAAGLSSAALSQPGADDSLQAALQGRYAAMKSAMAAHDGPALQAILTDDFESIDVEGRLDDGPAMIREAAQLKADPNRQSQTVLVAIKQEGGTAYVDQRYTMTTIRVAANGKKQQAELVTLSSDTWVRSHGAWRIRKTVTKQVDYSIDGKSVLHKLTKFIG